MGEEEKNEEHENERSWSTENCGQISGRFGEREEEAEDEEEETQSEEEETEEEPEYEEEEELEEESYGERIFESVGELREEVAASVVESRRNAKRVLESLKLFGEMVAGMPATIATACKAGEKVSQARDLSLPLIDLMDRIERIAGAYARPISARGIQLPFFNAREQALEEDRAKLEESFRILSIHAGNLLRAAGIERIPCAGKIFDPNTMSAVEVETNPSLPDHTVVAELLSGWRESVSKKLLRPAQVRVSRTETR